MRTECFDNVRSTIFDLLKKNMKQIVVFINLHFADVRKPYKFLNGAPANNLVPFIAIIEK